MSYGILLLRVVLGSIVAAHGAQKLFAWFGGSGPRGTASSFASKRRACWRWPSASPSSAAACCSRRGY
jgi:uncharacterized membrane protein YphA (DoxX/SURF4 family)